MLVFNNTKLVSQDSIRPSLPAETSFNKDAGHGENLFVKLHLENGQELLFGMDTGST
jgi:hypothetical protein